MESRTVPDFSSYLTPCILIEHEKMQANIDRMQQVCDRHHVELRPHIKTHKMVAVAKRQLQAGAAGLTCAKIGEAEAMLPSGVESIFIANSIVDPLQGPRLKAIAGQVRELILACTSEGQAVALEQVLAGVGLKLPVMLALDTGLCREGARSIEAGVQLAKVIHRLPHLELHGIYTHEGHSYGVASEKISECARDVLNRLLVLKKRIDPGLRVWPGCSVTAAIMATMPGVDAVRPGAYVFGDLSLTHRVVTMEWAQVALTVLATVVDKPEPGMALIDAGSKVFSSDKTPNGQSACSLDGRRIAVTNLSEEHGFITGEDVDELKIGQKLRFVGAHVCPVLNLTDEVHVIHEDGRVDCWPVEARGRVR